MTGHLWKGFLLACAASCIACGSDEGLGAISNKTPTGPAAEAPVFTTLELTPVVDTVYQGFSTHVYYTARSQSGDRITGVSPALSYASTNPDIATVSATGLVMGVAPGKASIWVAATIGGVTRSAVMTTTVLGSNENLSDDVLLTSGTRGWQPAEVHIKAGATVHWQSATNSWAGVPNRKLWLMNAEYSVVDSVDLSSGIGVRKFDSPDTVRYCSGGCWDPPDFGVIYIH